MAAATGGGEWAPSGTGGQRFGGCHGQGMGRGGRPAAGRLGGRWEVGVRSGKSGKIAAAPLAPIEKGGRVPHTSSRHPLPAGKNPLLPLSDGAGFQLRPRCRPPVQLHTEDIYLLAQHLGKFRCH
jgi:hypothetical protein